MLIEDTLKELSLKFEVTKNENKIVDDSSWGLNMVKIYSLSENTLEEERGEWEVGIE